MSTHSPLLAAALAAAERGWSVFPLRPGEKRPALHGYDRCPRTGACEGGHVGWEGRATNAPARVRRAWNAGAFNIGVAAAPSYLTVIDLDAAKPGETPPPPWDTEPGIRCGEDVLAVLAERAGQPIPADTFTVATPSGGLHLYFQAPVGVALRNTAGALGWKIDTRAHGGYVVGPGSIVNGRAYRVVHDTDIAPLPDWLTETLTPAPIPTAPAQPVTLACTGRQGRYIEAAIRAECQKVEQAPESQRNACLYAAALALGQLVAGGALSEAEHERVLLTAAGRHIAVRAFSEHQARKTIASGLRQGANRPRQVAA